VIVFLQRNDSLIVGIDGDELRLRVSRSDFGKTGQVNDAHRVAIGGCAIFVKIEDRKMAGRHLRDDTVIQVFVTLVFDCNDDELAIR